MSSGSHEKANANSFFISTVGSGSKFIEVFSNCIIFLIWNIIYLSIQSGALNHEKYLTCLPWLKIFCLFMKCIEVYNEVNDQYLFLRE
jgi:hypothetical protein